MFLLELFNGLGIAMATGFIPNNDQRLVKMAHQCRQEANHLRRFDIAINMQAKVQTCADALRRYGHGSDHGDFLICAAAL